jgi:hypothetical protein
MPISAVRNQAIDKNPPARVKTHGQVISIHGGMISVLSA